MTNSKYPTSESKVVGVYGLTTSSLRLSFPLYEKPMSYKLIRNYHDSKSQAYKNYRSIKHVETKHDLFNRKKKWIWIIKMNQTCNLYAVQ